MLVFGYNTDVCSILYFIEPMTVFIEKAECWLPIYDVEGDPLIHCLNLKFLLLSLH